MVIVECIVAVAIVTLVAFKSYNMGYDDGAEEWQNGLEEMEEAITEIREALNEDN